MTQERPEFSRPSLAPSEEMMLRWIRDGLVDAEIAVRLGISNQEVKERISRLASRMGVRDRDGLRASQFPRVPESAAEEDETEVVVERSGWRFPGNPLVLPIVGILLLGIGFIVWASGDSEDSAETDRSDFVSSPDSFPIVHLSAEDSDNIAAALAQLGRGSREPTQVVRASGTAVAEVRNGKSVFALGRLFYISRNWTAVDSVSMDGERVRVKLADQGVFRYDNGTVAWQPRNASSPGGTFVTTLGGTQVTLHLEPGDEFTDFLYGDDDSMGIFSRGSGPPVVFVWMDRAAIEVTYYGDVFASLE